MITFKNVRWITLYAIILLVLIFVLSAINVQLEEHAKITFQMYPHIISITIIYPLIGVLFGTAHILKEQKKQGNWKLNLGKMLIIGIPTFYLAYYTFIIFSFDAPLHFLAIPGAFFTKVILSYHTMHLFQILLGYTIITSFYKEEERILE
ncbi:hypothetical protein [Pseudogracilibacillus sp. SO30301A]|uniref:hypothetical protein n=1 Tax=Pseudogracilibacillus sp. SO30301A TaxID=3098291 RepID=UPI00300E0A3D